MPKQNTLFIIAVYNLGIEENLGEGIELNNGFRLTNNKNFIESLITDGLIESIGQIEYEGLINYAKAVIYSIEEIDIAKENTDNVYFRKVMNAHAFILDLWMVKDNSIQINVGFIQFPYCKPSKLILTHEQPSTVHSNYYSFSDNSMANGIVRQTNYTTSELKKAIELGENKVIVSKNDDIQSDEMEKLNSRLSKAFNFLQLARTLPHLELRIANYCSAFECLFADDNKELSHKLSERIAYFLEIEPEKRKDMFKFIKEVYGLRSAVIHGDIISNTQKKNLTDMSIKCDEILRRILNKLHDTPELDKFYRITHKNKQRNDIKKEFQDYFTNLLFGIEKNNINE